jgi:hypothetical protein
MERIRIHGVHQEPIFNFFRNRADEVDIVSMFEFFQQLLHEPRFTRLLADYQKKIEDQLPSMDLARLLNYKYLLLHGNLTKPPVRDVALSLLSELASRPLSPSQLEYLLEDVVTYLPGLLPQLLPRFLQGQDYPFVPAQSLARIYSGHSHLVFATLRLRNLAALARERHKPASQESLTRMYEQVFDMLEKEGCALLADIVRMHSIRVFLLPLAQFDRRIL